jgi:acyl-CoA thioester hydrolase
MNTEVVLADFPVVRLMQTRWADNDSNGHINNAVYFQLFDTAINGWLAENGAVTPDALPVVAESRCRFLSELSFPEPVRAALRVARIGRSSIRYDLALFRGSEETTPAAVAEWTHVYIDPFERNSVQLPDRIRAVALTACS